jgi:uncharacterized protein (TIGR03546 family)
MLSVLAKLLKILNSEESPSAVAWAIALAFVFSLLPTFSWAKWSILFIVAIFRVNLSTFIVFSAVFPLLAWLLDPWLNQFGLWLLTHESFTSFWKTVMQTGVGEFIVINNTLALSSFIVSVLLLYPLVLLAKKSVMAYRVHLKPKVEKLHLVQLFKSSKLYQMYQQLS